MMTKLTEYNSSANNLPYANLPAARCAAVCDNLTIVSKSSASPAKQDGSSLCRNY